MYILQNLQTGQRQLRYVIMWYWQEKNVYNGGQTAS